MTETATTPDQWEVDGWAKRCTFSVEVLPGVVVYVLADDPREGADQDAQMIADPGVLRKTPRGLWDIMESWVYTVDFQVWLADKVAAYHRGEVVC